MLHDVNTGKISLSGLLGKLLLPFMAISGLFAIALSQLRHLLSPSQFFTAIDLWFFLFGIGLIIIMNMIGHILRLHHRRQLFYWPAQMLLTLVIFISMIFIILVVSGLVRWQAIKSLSGLVSG